MSIPFQKETCYKENQVVTINLNKKDLREYLIEYHDLTLP